MDSKTLIASSQRWLQTGLHAYSQGSDRLDFAVHHFGVAVEHLLKAYLSSLHPALVADGKDFASLLHATGHGARTGVGLTEVKTITVWEAAERSRRLLKAELPVTGDDFKALANGRNGVAHLGVHEAAKARELLIICIRAVDALLKVLDVNPAEFWGEYRALHDGLAEAHANELKIAYDIKIIKAKEVFAQRFGSFPAAEQAALIALFISQTPGTEWGAEDAEPLICPACSQQGLAEGHITIDPVDVDGDDWVVSLYPQHFLCRACDLSLDLEELPLAGISSWIPTNYDPYEWAEPDEDLARGR